MEISENDLCPHSAGTTRIMEVYFYRGNEGEQVPETVEKLIVEEGVQELPDRLCYGYRRLLQVVLPNGLIKIGEKVFYCCDNLLEISICNTLRHIGRHAFGGCQRLTKVEFEFSTSSPHQLQTIEEGAFCDCSLSLSRIKLPSSVDAVGVHAFHGGKSLIEADLSTTSIANISGFINCTSLQTVSLPNTLELIDRSAFSYCSKLVTVVLSLDSQPIRIGVRSFASCKRLANVVLPKGSTAEEDSFAGCELLHRRYGESSSGIVTGLVRRFENFAIHKMCYNQSGITVEELRHQCIANLQEKISLVDEFGMTPFHIFFSTTEPRVELLEVLLDSLPNQMLAWKDANDKQPLDYLINNWTDGARSLLQRTLQKSMTDRLARWGTSSWVEDLQGKIQEIVEEDEKERRTTLCNEAYSTLEHYENIEATSILEMALWKWKLTKSGRTTDGTKQAALDREECRFLSESNVAISPVVTFLGILQDSSEA